MTTINLDTIVDLCHAVGVSAYVEQTGGGTATIYAGDTRHEPGWGTRYAAVAGPGWFEGPAWTAGRADSSDFYVGADDDGDSMPLVLGDLVAQAYGDTYSAGAIERLAAAAIVAQASQADPTRPVEVADVETRIAL